MDNEEKMDKIQHRVTRLEVQQEGMLKTLERRIELDDARWKDMISKVDGIGGQIKQARWVFYGIAITLGFLWMIGLDALKIASFFA